MSDAAMMAVLIIASVWTLLLFWKSTFQTTLAAALLVLIFGAGFAQTLIPVRFIIAATALTLLATATVSYRKTLAPGVMRVVCVSCTLCFVSYGALQSLVPSEISDPLFRYSVLFPLMFVVGYVASKTDGGSALTKIYVGTSLAMAALAVFERLQNAFLLAGDYENAGRLVRDGAIRSIVGAEHPLVLSVLLIAAVPLVHTALTSLTFRAGAYALLIAGIVSTNSRGALVLVCMWFVLAAAAERKILTRMPTSVLRLLGGASLVVGTVWMLAGTGSDSLASTSAVDASAEYRSSLYLFAARSLLEEPWGWGLAGLPTGVYVVSSYFGSLDIAATIDSEVALLLFDFGWLGFFGFLSLAFYLLHAGRLKSPYGQAALLVSGSGFYLALHSWSGLGSAWFLFLGLSMTGFTHQTSNAGPEERFAAGNLVSAGTPKD